MGIQLKTKLDRKLTFKIKFYLRFVDFENKIYRQNRRKAENVDTK